MFTNVLALLLDCRGVWKRARVTPPVFALARRGQGALVRRGGAVAWWGQGARALGGGAMFARLARRLARLARRLARLPRRLARFARRLGRLARRLARALRSRRIAPRMAGHRSLTLRERGKGKRYGDTGGILDRFLGRREVRDAGRPPSVVEEGANEDVN